MKSDYNLRDNFCVHKIEAELASEGIPTVEYIPTEGEESSFEIVVPREAFCCVCNMLSATRKELWEFQKKYRNILFAVLCYGVALLFIAGMWIHNLSDDKKDLQAEISALESQAAVEQCPYCN